MNNVYPVASDARASIRRKGAATGWKYNLPRPYETCTRIFKTMTSRVAILLYVAIFSVYGQSAMAQCTTPTVTPAGPLTVCQGGGTQAGIFTLTATAGITTGTYNWFENNSQINQLPTVPLSTGDVNETGTLPFGGGTYVITTAGGVSTLTINTTGKTPGTYNYTASRRDCGSNLSNSVAVTVNQTPFASQDATNTKTICQGGTASLTFYIRTAPGGTTPVANGDYTIQVRQTSINFPSGQIFPVSATTATTTIFVTPSATTTYEIVSVRNNTTGCSSTGVQGGAATSTVTVDNGPGIGRIDEPTDQCVGNTVVLSPNSFGLFTSAQWFRNGVPIADTAGHVSGSGTATLTISNVQLHDAADYYLTITNSAMSPCSTSTSNVVTLRVFDLPTVSVGTLSQTICQNQQPATIPLTFTGTPPFTVTFIDNGSSTASTFTSTTNNFNFTRPVPNTGIEGGTFTYTITQIRDANCVNAGVNTTTTVIVREGYQFSTTNTNPNCFGGNNGSIVVNQTFPAATAGLVTYTISPVPTGTTSPQTAVNPTSGPPAEATFSNLTAGTYVVTARYADGACTTSTTVTLTQPASAITVTAATTTQISCAGGTTTISTSATGGTGTFTYELINTATGLPVDAKNNLTPGYGNPTFFSNVPAGTYRVRATDKGAGSCQASSATLTVLQPAPITGTNSGNQTVSCFGGTASVSGTATGGTGSLTYTLSNGNPQFDRSNTTGTFTNVPAGTYTITARDANGCTGQVGDPITISQPSPITGAVFTNSNVSCNGGSNGEIYAEAYGGTPCFSFSLNGQPFQSGGCDWINFSNLPAGTYTVTARDANGCEKVIGSTVITAPSAVGGTPTYTAIQCFGGTSSFTVVNYTGGTGSGYQYSVDGTNFHASPIQIPAGTYTVTVMDDNSCQNVIGNVTITQPTQMTVTPSFTPLSCNANTSTVTLASTGGTGTKTYQLINNQTSQQVAGSPVTNNTGSAVFSNVPAGTYNYIVTDANGCTVQSTPGNPSTQVVIQSPTPVVLGTPVVQSPSCFGGGGTITVQASGGNSTSYTFRLFQGTTQVQQVSGAGPQTFTTVAPGTYSITVTDASNCAGTSTNVTVNQGTQSGNGESELSVQLSSGSGAFAKAPSSRTITFTVKANNNTANNVTLTITKPTPAYIINITTAGWTKDMSRETSGRSVFVFTGNGGQMTCGFSQTVSFNISRPSADINRQPFFTMTATIEAAPNTAGQSDPNPFNNVAVVNSSSQ